MAIISNTNNFFCEYHFIFRDKTILIETSGIHRLRKQIAHGKSLPSESILRKCLAQQAAADWFAEPEYNYSAMMLESSAPAPAGCEFIPLRDFFHITDQNMTLLASRAKGILSWRDKLQYCPKCGSKLEDDRVLAARICPKCSHQYFPQIEPAVIVLVSKGDEVLLVRHTQRIQNIWACVSGFIEMGETAEQCAAREVKEETGITVKNIRYAGSQSWPFPDQLMLAYRTEYNSGDITPQPSEIAEGAWFNKNALPEIPQPGSVAYNLITGTFG